jgi:hypothetical protein
MKRLLRLNFKFLIVDFGLKKECDFSMLTGSGIKKCISHSQGSMGGKNGSEDQ